MADFNVGALKGSININFGSVREAEKAIKSLQGSFSSYEKSNSKAASSEKARVRALAQVEKNLSNLSRVQRDQINVTAASSKALTSARSAAENYRSTVERFGAGSLEATKAQVQMQSAVDRANKSVRDSTNNAKAQVAAKQQENKMVAEAAKARQQAEKRTQQELAKTAAAEKARISAVSQADSQLRAINQASKEYVVQTTEQKRSVEQARAAINNYKNVVNQSGASSLQAAKAKAQMKEKVDIARTSVTRHGKEVKNLQGATQDLTKAVQVALGPLSGVASRITALAGLFNRNTLAVAGFVGAFTGLSVAMFQSVRAGAQLEQQMFKLETVLEATGNSTRFTAEELNQMSIELGKATMTSADQARRASSILMTFGIVSKESFEEAMYAAQGLSAVMGGNLESNVRRVGRLLEAPSRNLSALSRAGLQFTKQQEDLIKSLESTGDLAGAQAVVMERLEVFTKAATGETQGLNGALDTAGENFRRLFENASLNEGAVNSLTKIVNTFSKELESLSENEQVIRSLGTVFTFLGKAAAGSITIIIQNFDKLAAIVAGAGIAAGVSAISRSFMLLTGTTQAAAASMGLFTKATTVATAATARLNAVIRANPLGIALSIAGAVATWVYFNKEVNSVNRSLRQTQAEVRGITNAFRQFDREADARAYEERANLQNRFLDQLDQEQAKLRMLQRISDGYYGEVPKQIREALEEQERVVNLVQQHVDRLNELNDSSKDTVELLRQLKDNFSAAGSEFSSLTEKYVDGGNEVKKWKSELFTAKGILANFDKQVAGNAEAQKFLADEYKITRSALSQLISEIRAADPRLDVWRDFKKELENIDTEMRALSSGLSSVDTDILTALLGDDVDQRVIQRLAKDLGMVGASAERVALAIQGRRDRKSALEAYLGYTKESVFGELREIEQRFNEIRGGASDRWGGDVPPEIQARIDAEEELQKRLLAFNAADVATSPFTDLERLDQELLERQARLQEYYGTESEQYKNHLADLKEQSERSRVFLGIAQGAQQAADVVQQSMQLMQTANREGSDSYKAMAMMQATIASALAITKIWADNPNPAYAIPMTGLVSANLGAQIAAIQGAEYASGGMVRGPGSGTSDDIPAMLSNGEFVMRAEAVRRIGSAQLNAMNQGRMSGMASGGAVGTSTSGGSNTTVNVIDQRSNGAPIETRETTDQNGNKSIELMVKDAVNVGIARGDFDRTMGSSFGVRRNGRRV